MTEYETIKFERGAHGVVTLSLSRPDKHNAMSAQMIAELTAAAQNLGKDPAVRVVVLTGEGKSFCAGGDLKWMQAQMVATPDARAKEARALAEMLFALNVMPKPLIGAMQGNAFGGGVGLLSVCDIAIGVEGAKLGLTEVRLGLIPATIGPYVIARMGEARARRVFMSGRLFEAREAVELGLLAKAVSPDALEAAIAAEVAPYLEAAPEAVARAKALARSLGPRLDAEIIDHTISELVACWETETAKEGVAAFFDKRKAPWHLEDG